MVALAPYLAGIVVIVGRTLLIHLIERRLRGLALDFVIAAGLDTLYAVLDRAVDEEIELIRKIAQHMVGARPTITQEDSSAISRSRWTVPDKAGRSGSCR